MYIICPGPEKTYLCEGSFTVKLQLVSFEMHSESSDTKAVFA